MKVPLKPERAPRQQYKKVRGPDLGNWMGEELDRGKERQHRKTAVASQGRQLGRGRKKRGRSLVELLWVIKQSCESYVARTLRAGQKRDSNFNLSFFSSLNSAVGFG